MIQTEANDSKAFDASATVAYKLTIIRKRSNRDYKPCIQKYKTAS